MKVMTIRQPDDQAAELELIARIDGVPVAEAVREAIAVYAAARRADPEFQARLRQHIEAMKAWERDVADGDDH